MRLFYEERKWHPFHKAGYKRDAILNWRGG